MFEVTLLSLLKTNPPNSELQGMLLMFAFCSHYVLPRIPIQDGSFTPGYLPLNVDTGSKTFFLCLI